MGHRVDHDAGLSDGVTGGVPCSSSSSVMGSVESACERMVQTGLSHAENARRRRAVVAGVMGMVLRGSFLIGGYWEVVCAAAQLPEEPILPEQEMNLSAY
mmetsp:Transcript_36113/g.95155  ORF Transcript_36113/g.95155 Transcript_36113/m.95155 type:complete len:100 (-) Transcript_36113:168-467(-)